MESAEEKQKEILKTLDFPSVAAMQMASIDDIGKCISKNPQLSDLKVGELYMEYAETMGFNFDSCWEEVLRGIEGVKKFNTGIDAIDNSLKKGAELCSDELVELVGPSGGGKTTLALRIASRAIFEKDAEVIYIDSSNYCNPDNIKALLSLSMKSYEDSNEEMLYKKLENFRIINVYTLDELIIFLSTLISCCKNPVGGFSKPHICVIDSISAMSSCYQKSETNKLLKEVLTLIKKLNKKYHCMVLFTNNAYDGANTICELTRLTQEPIDISVDKSIYCCRGKTGTQYLVINS
ncbi:unnamed protein product [Moneuplotes crassus]|uniref:AAA+ ATPase domain-containing protein n=1 Tax=Euplotes crassus TaxID=5936 RepID=A0AAD1XPE3_EUPCR|nr:unnamed protein product [Moneuplotes crassus]